MAVSDPVAIAVIGMAGTALGAIVSGLIKRGGDVATEALRDQAQFRKDLLERIRELEAENTRLREELEGVESGSSTAK